MAGIELWKVEEIEHYLRDRFANYEIEHFFKGDQTACLFVLLQWDQHGKKEVVHQLLVMRKFLDRFQERTSLAGSLSAGDMVMRMLKAGDRTVELH